MKNSKWSTVCSALLLGFLLRGYLVSSANADTLRTVAFSGNTAPGTSFEFLNFSGNPVLNNAGQAAFEGPLTTQGGQGIWSEGGGTLALVARSGGVVPGTSEVFSRNFGSPLINNVGQTIFAGGIEGADFRTGNGIWSEADGSLTLVAREGSVAPGTNEVFSSTSFNSPRLLFNDSGQAAFLGRLQRDVGIWSGGGSSLALVAREGNPAPVTNANFTSFGSSRTDPVLNGEGQTAFVAGLAGPDVDSTNSSGIWMDRSGSLELFLRAGDMAPGTGVNFARFGFGQLGINDEGQVAFFGVLSGAGVNSSNSDSIWSDGGGSLALVAREGSPAPETSGNFTFLNNPVINGAGKTAFGGSFSGFEDFGRGIWSEGGGSLALVARSGSVAPGTSENFSSFFGLILNGAGQIALTGTLTGAGINDNNDRGIWAQDSAGKLTLIAREGDLLDVDDGPGTDFRTIRNFGFNVSSGNEDGRGSGFNDLGQLAFRVTFTDDTSGIFISSLVAVPEPNSLLLALIGLMIWRHRIGRFLSLPSH